MQDVRAETIGRRIAKYPEAESFVIFDPVIVTGPHRELFAPPFVRQTLRPFRTDDSMALMPDKNCTGDPPGMST